MKTLNYKKATEPCLFLQLVSFLGDLIIGCRNTHALLEQATAVVFPVNILVFIASKVVAYLDGIIGEQACGATIHRASFQIA